MVLAIYSSMTRNTKGTEKEMGYGYTLIVDGEYVDTFDSELELLTKYNELGVSTSTRIIYPDGKRERVFSGLDRDWNWCTWTRRSLNRDEVVRTRP